ncbi:hypothetical protein CTI12_AA387660 [Artemisia annua]|uniref:Granulin n=1 Tax=Artemisia annua TaxID=35608 RepID=A0A2U1MF46_ARTAN|nr:hypothetical protein CTI12_AA387660 [Artemisia annua]
MGASNSIITLLLLVIFVSTLTLNNAQCGGGTINCDGGQTCCQGGFYCCRGGSFCCPRGRTCSNPPGRCFMNTKDASGVVTKVQQPAILSLLFKTTETTVVKNEPPK